MSTLFNEQITYLNSVANTNSTTTFSAVDTYSTLILSVDSTINTDTNISVDGNTFKINTIGIYLVQYRLSLTGGNNDTYKLTMFLNDNELTYTTIDFSTKGGILWEVQNLALVKIDYTAVDRKGFGSSSNTLEMKAQNTTDTTSLVLKNTSFVIIKIQ